jgi:hypothetical protein
MDTVQVLGSAMGLGLLAGIRLYATVFALGLAIRMGWFQLTEQFAQLDVLAQTPVLVLSGTAFAIEFLADKIPWLDSLWDSVHTFIRPIGAAALGVTALGAFDPTTKTLIALLCGGVAFTGHTSKAATRLVVNHSPEPFSNVALSVAEDLVVPAGLWVVFQHPEIAVAVVSIFLVVFAWLSPKIFRLLNVSWTALRALVNKLFGARAPAIDVVLPEQVQGTVKRALETLVFQPLPANYAKKLEGKASAGVHCVATRTIRGLKNSTGYLCVTPEEAVFIARRMFRLRVQRWPWPEIQEAGLMRGTFLDPLVLKTTTSELGFDVFKVKKPSRHADFSAAWQPR